MASEYTPNTASVREGLVALARGDAARHGDVDLNVVASEVGGQFDRWLAEVERSAAEKALTDLACKIEATSKRTDNTFTEHAVVEAGGLELLREAAEVYRQERKEQ